MKYLAPFNAGLSFMMFVVSVYYQDLAQAAPWFSAFLGWTVVSRLVWEES